MELPLAERDCAVFTFHVEAEGGILLRKGYIKTLHAAAGIECHARLTVEFSPVVAVGRTVKRQL